MKRKMMFEERERENEFGCKYIKVLQLWKCTNSNESVYVNAHYNLFIKEVDETGREFYSVNMPTFSFETKGEMRFREDKKQWCSYIVQDGENDVDDFWDEDADYIYYESTEFEKEVFEFWKQEMINIKARIEFENK